MKISVIIPIYQVEKYVEKCLVSVLNQTYKNLEIILINDGTKDDSIKKIEKYFNDKRIILISTKNLGVSNARNLGLEKATGEYIHFLDSDDWLVKETYEILIKQITNEDIITFNYTTYDNLTNKILKEKYIEQEKEEKLKNNKRGSYYFRLTENPIWNKLYKKEFIKEFSFFQELVTLEDLLWNLICFFNTDNVKYIDKSLYFYRLNTKDSLTNKEKEIKKLSKEQKDKYFYSYSFFDKYLEEYISKRKNQLGNFELLRIKILQMESLGRINKEVSFDEFTTLFEQYLKKETNVENINLLLSEIKSCIKNKKIKIKLGKWLFKKIYWKQNIVNFKVIKRRILINLGVK